jgi:DNA-binding MarR family transcriptional regulator
VTTKALYKLYRAVEEARKIDPEMQAHTFNIFLTVCINPNVTMKDLGERLGLSQATMSRNIAALGKVHRLNRPGYDLCVAEEDPVERRRKVVNLTPKGKRVRDALVEIMEQPS